MGLLDGLFKLAAGAAIVAYAVNNADGIAKDRNRDMDRMERELDRSVSSGRISEGRAEKCREKKAANRDKIERTREDSARLKQMANSVFKNERNDDDDY